jgi:hypothetical protein
MSFVFPLPDELQKQVCSRFVGTITYLVRCLAGEKRFDERMISRYSKKALADQGLSELPEFNRLKEIVVELLCLEFGCRYSKPDKDKRLPCLYLGFWETPIITWGERHAPSIEKNDSSFALLLRLAAQVKKNINKGYCHFERDLLLDEKRQEISDLKGPLGDLLLRQRPIDLRGGGTGEYKLNIKGDAIDIDNNISKFQASDPNVRQLLSMLRRSKEDILDKRTQTVERRDFGEAIPWHAYKKPVERFGNKLNLLCRNYLLVSESARIVMNFKGLVLPPEDREGLRQIKCCLKEAEVLSFQQSQTLDLLDSL